MRRLRVSSARVGTCSQACAALRQLRVRVRELARKVVSRGGRNQRRNVQAGHSAPSSHAPCGKATSRHNETRVKTDQHGPIMANCIQRALSAH
eukprot:scaffold61183_cov62-Phaeocystis_antarctica.AAC.5